MTDVPSYGFMDLPGICLPWECKDSFSEVQ